MIETILLISTSLLLITLGFILVYFRKLRDISEKYVEAKNVLGDIILSFKTDLERQEDKIRSISQMIKDLSLRDESSKKIEELRAADMRIEKDLRETSNMGKELSANVEKLGKRVEDLLVQQQENKKRISELEETRRKERLVLDKIETAIPIRRERALAHLTDTELRVLDILAEEGEKTALEIRDKIKLTREHSARLMKSLYTRGYVERTIENLPYVYRIKDEMMEILKKQVKT